MNALTLLERIEYTVLSGDPDQDVLCISRDNRSAEEGALFIATKGARFDSHDSAVLQGLLEKGVRLFAIESKAAFTEEIRALSEEKSACFLLVENSRHFASLVYAAWYGHPAERMLTVGVTGSKGKTTTAHMLTAILRASGRPTGLIGTNGVEYPGVRKELLNTTPDADVLQKELFDMAEAGCTAAVIEVSSQAMKMHRVDGFVFDIGVFMNIQTGDHIGPNEHESFEDYLYCKAQLLNHSRLALINGDDPYLSDLLPLVKVPYELFGGNENALYRAGNIRDEFDPVEEFPGIRFDLLGKLQGSVFVNMPGDFNTWNALAAIACADHFGIPEETSKEALRHIHIKGRTDIVFKGEHFSVCVDFAHNGESAWHHLEALRAFHPKRLVCIFGADGNRSKGRRYGMGEAAGKLADFSIVTSGHNRFETFEAILEDTKVGLHRAEHPNYIAIKNRKEAIRYAFENAEDGDLITILGLGHENWQEDQGVKYEYSDTEYVLSLVKEMGLRDIRKKDEDE